MAEAYAKLIMAGKKTIEQVPAKIKEDVLTILEELGWEAHSTENND